MLPKKLIDLLQETDESLFMTGACHVFAREVADYFASTGYEIWCMEEEQWIIQSPGSGESKFGLRHLVHVYAKLDASLIDVRGIREEQSHRDAYEAEHRTNHGFSTSFHKTFVRRCTLEELFTITQTESDTGPMNRNRLYLHEDFVDEATRRARALIKNSPGRFLVDSPIF
jgi:hypothetical protein